MLNAGIACIFSLVLSFGKVLSELGFVKRVFGLYG
jgi:hypothetical protein